MGTVRITVSIDARQVVQLDRLVAQKLFRSRSDALQEALQSWLSRARKRRFAKECAKLDPKHEQAFAENWAIEEY